MKLVIDKKSSSPRKYSLAAFFVSVLLLLVAVTVIVIWTDPFMHYHGPLPYFHYQLDNERMQNDGIVKNLKYNAIISGTSMTENFRTSEFNALFAADSIKIPYTGATFNEVSRAIGVSYETGHELKYVLRSFDLNHIIEEKDAFRTDLGVYPWYLYNRTVLDDYKYILNGDVIFKYSIPELASLFDPSLHGITSFDEYMSWREDLTTGKKAVIGQRTGFAFPALQPSLTEEEREIVVDNIRHNILRPADEHPETTFIYFIPPYNVFWWGLQKENGVLEKIQEAEMIALKEMLMRKNIKVHCFTNMTEFTSDLNNYIDESHYLSEMNSLILNLIRDEKYLLDSNNLDNVLEFQKEYYDKNYQHFT